MDLWRNLRLDEYNFPGNALTLLSQDVIWTSIQRSLNVMDATSTSKQRCLLIGYDNTILLYNLSLLPTQTSSSPTPTPTTTKSIPTTTTKIPNCVCDGTQYFEGTCLMIRHRIQTMCESSTFAKYVKSKGIIINTEYRKRKRNWSDKRERYCK